MRTKNDVLSKRRSVNSFFAGILSDLRFFVVS